MKRDYLIVEPDRPTAAEYARGAKLIPSMLDEGVRVWRVPNEPTNEGDDNGETKRGSR